MKSMYKHWGLHIFTNINHLNIVLDSFWAVWEGLLWCLKVKLILWCFPRYWWFSKQYHGSYLLICLISQPLLITLRRDYNLSKGLFKGFRVPLRLWELLKNWWRYGWMKFVTKWTYTFQVSFLLSCSSEILLSHIRDMLHWDITRTHLACTYLYNSWVV